MKAFLKVAVLIIAVAIPSLASGEAKETGKLPSSVIARDPDLGFKLSEAAIKRLGIRFLALKGAGPWEVPKTALVHIKRSVGVYREVDGFLSFVVIETAAGSNRIRSEDLREDDRVAVEGGAFLRVIDLDLSGGGGDSCGG